jgi:hypothetical protein
MCARIQRPVSGYAAGVGAVVQEIIDAAAVLNALRMVLPADELSNDSAV